MAALADISSARLRAMDSARVAFGTRHTMSDTVSATRGIGLDAQLGDVWVGVRAVGANGHGSLTTVVGAPGGPRLHPPPRP